MHPLFESLEDCPSFRDTVKEMEERADALNNRCGKLLKGAQKYREGLTGLMESQKRFSEHLQEFCGGMDDESMALGGPGMTKFVAVFEELSWLTRVLRTQLETSLCECLQQNWIKGYIAEAKESRRRCDKKTAEYEAARLKNLGHKNRMDIRGVGAGWKKEDPAKLQSDMEAAQLAADEARFDCARKFADIESRKRHEFLNVMLSTMEAHHRHYKQSSEMLKNLEGDMGEAKLSVSAKQEQQAESLAMLDQDVRDVRDGRTQSRTRAAGPQGQPSQAWQAGGPMQMTSATAAMQAEFNGHIQQTQALGHQNHLVVLKQGWLLKRSSNMRGAWKRRFFVLDSAGMLYYTSNKEKTKSLQNTVNLLTSTVKSDAEEGGEPLRFCFRVVAPDKAYTLQADNEMDRRDWMEAIQVVIACLLNGSVDVSRLKLGKPARPTHHSRSSSLSSDLDMPLSAGLLRTPSRTNSLTASDYESVDLPSDPKASPRSVNVNAASPREMMSPAHSLPGALSPPPISAHHSRTHSSGAPPRPPPSPQPESYIQKLRQIPGNACCADCGARSPDWASLNLGILMCIECSGQHRKLGVHISKVRSITLDTRVWDEPVLAMMASIGNTAANAIWEERLPGLSAVPSGAWDKDVWSADADDDGPGPIGAGLASATSNGASQMHMEDAPAKITSAASAAEKAAFITAKYVDRRYMGPKTRRLPQATAQALLWDSVQAGDAHGAVHACVGGADLNAPFQTDAAAHLAEDAEVRCNKLSSRESGARGQQLGDAPQPAAMRGEFSIVHCACQVGNAGLLEYLLQNGAGCGALDGCGRSPLHYSLLYNHPALACMLLRRNAKCVRDRSGISPLDLALAKGHDSHEELLGLLASQPETC
ncbi:hypothetical protein WJX74_003816 [Apatococcus lobatus]|uniref:Uncharacterized protein n=1 Tax=Apatococcus lobatus TaxID=904363 RepID=A0AAW1QND6_9CHLO